MRIGVTEIKRPGSDTKEVEPLVKPTNDSLSKKTASRRVKGKRANT
jgi:hypothetical protein